MDQAQSEISPMLSNLTLHYVHEAPISSQFNNFRMLVNFMMTEISRQQKEGTTSWLTELLEGSDIRVI
jgi:hypothetical protein